MFCYIYDTYVLYIRIDIVQLGMWIKIKIRVYYLYYDY